MSLMDSLGLGGVFGYSYPPVFNQQAMLGYAQAQQQYIPTCHCLHGADCPVCIENAKKREEEISRQGELKTQKKLEYENRCKKYMDNFKLDNKENSKCLN